MRANAGKNIPGGELHNKFDEVFMNLSFSFKQIDRIKERGKEELNQAIKEPNANLKAFEKEKMKFFRRFKSWKFV
ncbi:MAG: hypothetical protein DI535_29350 [Citrobacter freundii]|nr:MAG: hypothetical protein DI535_29350 [Citrobacter freundii]